MRSSKLLLQRLSKAPALSTTHHPLQTHSHTPSYSLQCIAKAYPQVPKTRLSSYVQLTYTSPTSGCRPQPFNGRPNIAVQLRSFVTTSPHSRESKAPEPGNKVAQGEQPNIPATGKNEKAIEVEEDELNHEDEERGFSRSEKANQASQVNLSARLARDPKDQGAGGLGETWRLVKIARPEAGVLGWAFLFLIVSSSISMSIPFSIGKFIDVATKPEMGSQLYGFDLSTLYIALGSILVVGASANYGRILILRIVGERIVARLRSQLFRRTFTQNAEFFDANRVGDLISRLSSDTVIVGKSITQNLSDGLRSLVSGVAGLTLMAYVSLKLTSVLAIFLPPVAIGTFVFGRLMRDLSRKIQKNLGTLTKIAEERLGNVKTSQAFAGEILEVARYNKQVKKIFSLGKREAFITATYFSTVSSFLVAQSNQLTPPDGSHGEHDNTRSTLRRWRYGAIRWHQYRGAYVFSYVHGLRRIKSVRLVRFLV